MRVLFVCLGNICRSPSAEAVARVNVPEWEFDSAGTAGWHVGKPPYDAMRQVVEAAGFPMSDLRARQFGPGDFSSFDLIIAMDASNLEDIEAQRPAGNTTPVRLATEWGSGADVPDPYYTRDFDGALGIITEAVQQMADAHQR